MNHMFVRGLVRISYEKIEKKMHFNIGFRKILES